MPDLNLELHSGLLQKLRCPVCGYPLSVSPDGRSLGCFPLEGLSKSTSKTHLFDGGAGGYVPLLLGIAVVETPRMPSVPVRRSSSMGTMPLPPKC